MVLERRRARRVLLRRVRRAHLSGARAVAAPPAGDDAVHDRAHAVLREEVERGAVGRRKADDEVHAAVVDGLYVRVRLRVRLQTVRADEQLQAVHPLRRRFRVARGIVRVERHVLVGLRREERRVDDGAELVGRQGLLRVERIRCRVRLQPGLEPRRRRVVRAERERADEKPPRTHLVLEEHRLADQVLVGRRDFDDRVERNARLELHRRAILHQPPELPAAESFVRHSLQRGMPWLDDRRVVSGSSSGKADPERGPKRLERPLPEKQHAFATPHRHEKVVTRDVGDDTAGHAVTRDA